MNKDVYFKLAVIGLIISIIGIIYGLLWLENEMDILISIMLKGFNLD